MFEGGSGSGLGARVLQEIRNEFNSKYYICSCIITPFSVGETCLQYYNSLFTYNYAIEYSDIIINISNEYILNTIINADNKAKTVNKNTKQATQIPFNIMNKYIADALLDCFAPIDNN